MSQDGVLTDEAIHDIMSEEKPNQAEQIRFKRDDFKEYFPPRYTDEQIKRDTSTTVLYLWMRWENG